MTTPIFRRRFLCASWLAALCLLTITACETPPHTDETHNRHAIDIVNGEPVGWPFRPVEMRIHPLTRIATADDATFLEVRIEFRDLDGHTTRGLGELIVDLQPDDDVVNSWRVDLTDLAVNAQRFDDVSRTYLLRLRIDPEDLPARPHLQATYRAADGRTLNAEYRMESRQ